MSGLLLRGSMLRTGGLFVTLLVAFFLTPFVIGALGQRHYGLWTLVGTVIGYYGMLDFGLSKAAQQFIARAIGARRPDDVNAAVTTALAIFTVMGVVAFAISVALAALAPEFFSEAHDRRVFAIVMLVMGVNVLIAFPMMAFHGLYSANLRYDIASGLDIAKLIVRTLLIVFFLSRGHSIVALAVITTVVDVAGHVARLVIALRLFPTTQVRPGLYDRTLLRPMFAYGGKAFVHSLADLLRFQVDLLVVTAFMSLSAAAVYAIGGQLIGYFRRLLGTLFGVLVTVYARRDASGERRQMAETFAFTSRLAAGISVLLAGAAAVFGEVFIRLWVGDAFADSYRVLVILLAGTLFHVIQEPALALIYGAGRHGPYAKVALLEGVLNVTLSVVLVQSYGLIGVALGTAIPMLLSAGFLMIYVCRYLDASLAAHALTLARIIAFGLLLHAGAWLIVQRVQPDSWSALALWLLVILPLQAAVMFMFAFDAAQRRAMLVTLMSVGRRADSEQV